MRVRLERHGLEGNNLCGKGCGPCKSAKKTTCNRSERVLGVGSRCRHKRPPTRPWSVVAAHGVSIPKD